MCPTARLHRDWQTRSQIRFPATEYADSLQKLLDDAIASLSVDNGQPFQPNKQDDLMLGGDLSLWLRFAHTLKQKFYLPPGESELRVTTTNVE